MALSLIPAKERRNLGCLEKGGRSASDVKPGDPQKREKLGLLQTFPFTHSLFIPHLCQFLLLHLPKLMQPRKKHAAHDDSESQKRNVRAPEMCVDYLSYRFDEMDLAASWQVMTKQKKDIVNGLRLENASWRTWAKHKNNLKTVSPETLNWQVFSHFFLIVCYLMGIFSVVNKSV